jgi:predicted RNA-binding protein (TIGR00451 family)
MKVNSDKLKKKTSVSSTKFREVKERAKKSMPNFGEIESELFGKKDPVTAFMPEDHVKIYATKNKKQKLVPILIELSDGSIIPHLRIAMEYQGLLKAVYVDDGAFEKLINGADLMIPGIKGMADGVTGLKKNDVFEIRCIGTEIPFAIAVSKVDVSVEEAKNRKGKGAIVAHVLKDGLWEYRDDLEA